MKATFAAGCFWHVEVAFRKVKGILSTSVGYTGGSAEKPTYENVCSGRTGHAEAVQVTFDPKKVTYEKLLGVFWRAHDPTQMNRQGPDVGEQYRSVIFYHNKMQKEAAMQSIQKAQKLFSKPIATKIVRAGTFWRAEEYHQQYYKKCRII